MDKSLISAIEQKNLIEVKKMVQESLYKKIGEQISVMRKDVAKGL